MASEKVHIEKSISTGTIVSTASLLFAMIVQGAIMLNAHYDYKAAVEQRLTTIETLLILMAPPEMAERLRKINAPDAPPSPAYACGPFYSPACLSSAQATPIQSADIHRTRSNLRQCLQHHVANPPLRF